MANQKSGLEQHLDYSPSMAESWGEKGLPKGTRRRKAEKECWGPCVCSYTLWGGKFFKDRILDCFISLVLSYPAVSFFVSELYLHLVVFKVK